MLSRWFTAYVGENILITRDCAVHGKTGLGFNRCHLAFGLVWFEKAGVALSDQALHVLATQKGALV